MNAPPTPSLYTLSLHDALPISAGFTSVRESPCPVQFPFSVLRSCAPPSTSATCPIRRRARTRSRRSEEHTSELQSQSNLVCRLLLEKKKKTRVLIVIIQKRVMH